MRYFQLANLYSLYDPNDGWSFQLDREVSTFADLYLGFTEQTFDNLKFGFELRQGSSIYQYGMFPLPGVRYLKSNQKYLETVRLFVNVDQAYTLRVWGENRGRNLESLYNFSTVKPPKPFNSWLWTDNAWVPPIPYPTDGGYYQWNEETQQWVQV